jgi:hypothetical protein
MTSIRFFTTLMMRDGEEVPPSVIPWLDKWATIEFDEDRPITAVWQSSRGQRRVCWFASDDRAVLVAAHMERYGEEPFWVVHLPTPGNRQTLVAEHDDTGVLVQTTVWTFDRMGLAATESVRSPDGALLAARDYECLSDGLVLQLRERVAPGFVEHKRSRLRGPVVPELCAEPFPCGGTIAGGDVRLLGVIAQNQHQARCRSVHLVDGVWSPSVTTIATVPRSAVPRARAVLDLAVEGVAPLVGEGPLLRERSRPGKTYYGIVESALCGETLQARVSSQPLDVHDALAVTIQVSDVVLRAHEAGVSLGGVRPELVMVDQTTSGLSLAGILHRAPALLAMTHHGEAYLIPPIFRSAYHAPDDVYALAQLLWYAATGGHPFLAADHVEWRDEWTHDLRDQRERQPWLGPPSWLSMLERCLFANLAQRPTLMELQRELRALLA